LFTITNGKIHISSDTDEKGIDLVEPYLQNTLADNFTTHIGQNEVFVLGDNRPRSSDSRAWGTLPIDNITGRALVRLFPFRDIKYLSTKNQTYGDNTAVASHQ
jgi:signal peptidase I